MDTPTHEIRNITITPEILNSSRRSIGSSGLESDGNARARKADEPEADRDD
jgi:hypothetical protein